MPFNLTVKPAFEDDVYLDTVRIPKDHRQNLEPGFFYQISNKNQTIYVALRGSTSKSAVIQIDEANRKRLGVTENTPYNFEIKRLGLFKLLLPIWHATNPYTRFAGRLGLIGFMLGLLGSMQALYQLGCWLTTKFCL